MTGDLKKPKKQPEISSETASKSADFKPAVPGRRLAPLSKEQYQKLQEIENKVLLKTGNIDDLEAAIGVLRMGHHFGWKVLYIAHSKKTIKKFEELLEIKIKDFFEEKGPAAERSTGLNLAETHTNFWKVVSGDIKITNRKDIE